MISTVPIKRYTGFTLLEVMIALAILAGVSASIAQILAAGVESTQAVEKQSQAYILAAAKMDELLLLDRVETVSGSGTFTDTPFRYLIEVTPQPYAGQQRGFALWHINLQVLWGDEDDQSAVQLESLKSQATQ